MSLHVYSMFPTREQNLNIPLKPLLAYPSIFSGRRFRHRCWSPWKHTSSIVVAEDDHSDSSAVLASMSLSSYTQLHTHPIGFIPYWAFFFFLITHSQLICNLCWQLIHVVSNSCMTVVWVTEILVHSPRGIPDEALQTQRLKDHRR